jgi:hypothetical protein
MLPMDIFPAAIRSPAVTGSTTSRVVHHVDLDVVCPRPPLRVTPCQAAPHHWGHQLCAAWPQVVTGEPLRTVPRYALETERALLHPVAGQAMWAVLARLVRRYGQAMASRMCAVRVGRAQFRPRSRLKIKKSFSIFYSVSN